MTEPLSHEFINDKIQELKGWELQGRKIVKLYEFPSFMPAIDFVNRIAPLAEKADHHPDISINYRRVTLSLSTHSEGGLTLKDFDLAQKIDAIISA